MAEPSVKPYGSWPSPITAVSLVEGAVGISEVVADPVDSDLLWWGESRPDENGRTAIMRHSRKLGESSEVTPTDANVRTLVHEYGGAAWSPHDGSLYYVEFSDQRLRRLGRDGDTTLLTPEPEEPRALRYADGRVSADGRWFICVCERHHADREPDNEIVAVATDGSLEVNVLWSVSDFVMSPRFSVDGRHIAWISWDHPNMPWDTTRLHVHEFGDGALGAEILHLDDGMSSLAEPGWTTSGLKVCSDHDEWWNLYDVDLDTGELVGVVTGPFEIATPPWVFGMQRWACPFYARTRGESVIAVAGLASGDELIVDGATVALPDTSISSMTATSGGAGEVAYAGAGFGHETEVVTLSVRDGTVNRSVVRSARELPFDRGLLLEPEAISFPTGTSPTGPDGAAEAHALYYPPTNPSHVAPPDERPPLLVLAHGGPTAQARRQLQAGILYWTSRGIAVVDVDYRGSTGYGRTYRRALDGVWGLADVEDCVAAARFLADRGDVDGERLMIRGGSAGGFTVLAALAFHDMFAAGASRYGVADLEALATDTHKFESRYLDTLVGPYPAERERYSERSPIHHVDGFSVPMIVLQGSEDAIVPPNQAEMIVEALESRGVPVAYLLFEGEQHGFRSAENIVRALESELTFFGRVLGFEPAGDLAEVDIRGM